LARGRRAAPRCSGDGSALAPGPRAPAEEMTSRAIRYWESKVYRWLAERSRADTSDRGCQTPGAVPANGQASAAGTTGVGSNSSDARPLQAVTTEEEDDRTEY
jgi:hypothetical protein